MLDSAQQRLLIESILRQAYRPAGCFMGRIAARWRMLLFVWWLAFLQALGKISSLPGAAYREAEQRALRDLENSQAEWLRLKVPPDFTLLSISSGTGKEG